MLVILLDINHMILDATVSKSRIGLIKALLPSVLCLGELHALRQIPFCWELSN